MEELMRPSGFEGEEHNADRLDNIGSREEHNIQNYNNGGSMYAGEREADGREEDESEDDDRQLEGGLSEWGDIDPQTNNSPFPDPNEPTAPGSAV